MVVNTGCWAQAVDVDFSLSMGGIISGNVSAASGTGTLSGLTVSAYQDSSDATTTTTTQANGDYAIGGLTTGRYIVKVSARGTPYAGQFYSDAYDEATATKLSVTRGQTTSNINFSLATGGSIAGAVTATSNGQPIRSARVLAYPETGGSLLGLVNMQTSFTQSDGTYRIYGLPPGNYRVLVLAEGTDYAGEFYNNTYTENASTAVRVSLGQTTANINFGLATGGRIIGRVTSASSGSALSGLYVSATDFATLPGVGVADYGAITQSDGAYSITGLPPGNYRVQVDTLYTAHSDYAGEYHANSYRYSTADPVNASLGQTSANIDFDLSIGGVISGIVSRRGDGQGLANVAISLYNEPVAESDFLFFFASTATDGSYRLSGLPPAIYTLVAHPANTLYAPELYDDAYRIDDASDINIALGDVMDNIDIELAVGGSISGVVAHATDGKLLENIYVTADSVDENTVLSDFAGIFNPLTASASDGTYTLSGLVPGEYLVKTDDPSNHYLDEYYDNAIDYLSATPVIVTLAELYGDISGTVTRDRDGQPIAGLPVFARAFDLGTLVASAQTRSDGSYTISGLNPGSYSVGVDTVGTEYKPEYYDDIAGVDAASEVVVVSNQTTAGINFGLAVNTDDLAASLLPMIMLLLLD